MFSFILALLVVLLLAFGPRFLPRTRDGAPLVPASAVAVGRILLGLWALYLVLSTSIIHIPRDKVGIVTKIYGATSLPEGHIIATNGETGIQAEPIPPGTFRISLLFNILNRIEEAPIPTIPSGFYGRIVARDGANLPEGQIMADAWPDKEFTQFLNAEYFMKHGGQRGAQLSILRPGSYPINTALFQIKVGYRANGKDILKTHDDIWDENGYHMEETPLDTSITTVPVGFVGVVRSSVQEKGKDCRATIAKVDSNTFSDSLVAEVVPQGCRGIWQTALPPNDYYLNRDAYDISLVDTKVQALEFKGGYVRRYIDLKVDSKGEFTQTERRVEVPVPPDAADEAVFTKAEGWEIPQELRAVLQISPERAPIIVAAVGGVKEIEKRIMIPSIRSHVRNVLGGTVTLQEPTQCATPPCPLQSVTRQTKVLDTIEQRPLLENEVLQRVQLDGRRAGVDVKEIRFGESAIPPELLLARQREQLAEQLKRAFVQEQGAQEQRQKTEQARATADQQASLVTAQISLQTSKLSVERRTNEGLAEQKFLEAQAAGQRAQTDVLGQDRVMTLQIVDKVLARPEVFRVLSDIRWPNTVIFGSGSPLNLEGAAAILKGGFGGGDTPARSK